MNARRIKTTGVHKSENNHRSACRAKTTPTDTTVQPRSKHEEDNNYVTIININTVREMNAAQMIVN